MILFQIVCWHLVSSKKTWSTSITKKSGIFSSCFTTRQVGAQQKKTHTTQKVATLLITQETLDDLLNCLNMHQKIVRL